MKKYLAGAAALAMLAGLMTMYTAQANGAGDHGQAKIACGNNGEIEYSPTVLWPPDHKYRDITVTYTDPDGATTSLTLTATPHDEVLGEGSEATEMVGSGATPFPTDSLGGAAMENDSSVTVVVQARGERSGKGDGRTYEWEYDAESNMGTDGCESDPDTEGDGIIVSVPHDCRDNGCNQINPDHLPEVFLP
jgi:hypothetical protein